jgi:septal ring factor EnvC (AmiA/AmiB activator)
MAAKKTPPPEVSSIVQFKGRDIDWLTDNYSWPGLASWLLVGVKELDAANAQIERLRADLATFEEEEKAYSETVAKLEEEIDELSDAEVKLANAKIAVETHKAKAEAYKDALAIVVNSIDRNC